MDLNFIFKLILILLLFFYSEWLNSEEWIVISILAPGTYINIFLYNHFYLRIKPWWVIKEFFPGNTLKLARYKFSMKKTRRLKY